MSGIYKVRRFQAEDAEEVSALIAKTLRTELTDKNETTFILCLTSCWSDIKMNIVSF